MNKTLCRTLPVLCVALAVVLLGTVAVAQDVFQVNYYANANTPGAPDATVRIDNPGLTYGNLCAMVYVFTADQQMAECCGCVQSHNDLNTISVNSDLTSNPLTGVPPITGVVKVVAAAVNGAPCDPTANVTPTPNLRAWATHIQNVDSQNSLNTITETEFLDSTLGAAELTALQAQCSFINILGSGHGICTCGSSNRRRH
jgi:hypothetical protein